MTPASYAMSWWVDGGPRSVGRVELAPDGLALAATRPSPAVEYIPLRELERVMLVAGTLHLERAALPTLHLSSLDRPGTLRELHDRMLEPR